MTSARCRCRWPASPRSPSPAASATAFRWGSSWRGRPSVRTGCWIAPLRWSRRWASTAVLLAEEVRRHERTGRVGAGHRPRDSRSAEDAHQDVLRVRAFLRRPPKYPYLPTLSRSTRDASGRERPGGALRDHDRPGAGLRDRAALAVSPQELLLSRPAQGVPDLPVRRAAVQLGTAGRRAHTPR